MDPRNNFDVCSSPDRGDTGQTPTVAKLSLALAKAQGIMKPAVFDRENPGFHFKYATLASIWEAIRGPLSANELAVCQEPLAVDGRVGVITTLMHSSGEWKRSTLLLKPTRDDPQGVGSALTYARRYSLAAMTGAVAEEDDDGNTASQAKIAPPPRPQLSPQARQASAGASTSETPVPTLETIPDASQDVKAAYEADLAELKLLKVESGLTNQQCITRIRSQYNNRDFHLLTPKERGEVKAMLRTVIAAHEGTIADAAAYWIGKPLTVEIKEP